MEVKSAYAILKSPVVCVTLTQFLFFKEYSQFSMLNKKFYNELWNQKGARSCLHYIKLQVVDKQPLYTVNFKHPQIGSSGGLSLSSMGTGMGGGGRSIRGSMMSGGMGALAYEGEH
jgi:hypothetical protein